MCHPGNSMKIQALVFLIELIVNLGLEEGLL